VGLLLQNQAEVRIVKKKFFFKRMSSYSDLLVHYENVELFCKKERA
jgi:hypothetical protein